VAQTTPSKQLDFDSLPDSAFIRLKPLIALCIVPYSSSTLWRKVRSGEFPSPVKISSGITAWRVCEVRQWRIDPQAFKAKVVLQVGEGLA
jgi:prophage regulatory protein